MRLLREFISANINSMFGLNRQTTINAFKDISGGPDFKSGSDFEILKAHIEALMVAENDTTEDDFK